MEEEKMNKMVQREVKEMHTIPSTYFGEVDEVIGGVTGDCGEATDE
jgi:hypothetical protein